MASSSGHQKVWPRLVIRNDCHACRRFLPTTTDVCLIGQDFTHEPGLTVAFRETLKSGVALLCIVCLVVKQTDSFLIYIPILSYHNPRGVRCRMSKFTGNTLLYLVLLLLSHRCTGKKQGQVTTQYQRWYPEFGGSFEQILRDNCSAEYTAYRTMKVDDAPIFSFTGGAPTTRLAQPVVNCILSYTSEFIKANMASAAVVLGLTPTILATIGNSVEETSTLSVMGRRPLLALCLAAGSPAVSPARSFQYLDPWNLLRDRVYRLRPKRFSAAGEFAVVYLEYVLAAAVIVNTVTLCNQLGNQVSFTFAPHLTYLPLLWSILGITLHITGALEICVRRVTLKQCTCGSVLRLVRDQFLPLDSGITSSVHFRKETYTVIALSWYTSLLVICHLIYGTLTFSSMLFISVRDSITVIGRYMASALLCRAILMYKLSLLRDYHNEGRGEDVELRERHSSRDGLVPQR
jgi:hypothetical protein